MSLRDFSAANNFELADSKQRSDLELPNTATLGDADAVSLGGGSFSSHVTEEKRTGLQPGISPLCGTAIPGCAPLSAPGVHCDSVLAALAPPVVRAFCVPDGFAGANGASRLFLPASLLRSKIPIQSESGRLAQREISLRALGGAC